jgi:hypothetical protein
VPLAVVSVLVRLNDDLCEIVPVNVADSDVEPSAKVQLVWMPGEVAKVTMTIVAVPETELPSALIVPVPTSAQSLLKFFASV